MTLDPLSRRLSKPLGDIQSLKKDFSVKNQELLERALSINNFYCDQPPRLSCKACAKSINNVPDFINHNAPFSICRNCGHLNGLHEDTLEFSGFLYKDSGGSNYSANYMGDYQERMNNIYYPKFTFLQKTLEPILGTFSIEDFGCGGGHFLNSIPPHEVSELKKGYDISIDLINLANKQSSLLSTNSSFYSVESEDALLQSFCNTDSSVVSMLGVLEHLRFPRKFFEAFQHHETCKALYIQVPMFGLSVLFENSFSSIFPRLLSSGHTHLFSRSSIAYILEEFSLFPLAEWHFGTDAMDLRRSLLVNANLTFSNYALEFFEDNVFSSSLMEDLQKCIDSHSIGCQTHLVILKKFNP